MRAKVHRMITMHNRQTDRQTDGQTNIVATARRFVVTNASHANSHKTII